LTKRVAVVSSIAALAVAGCGSDRVDRKDLEQKIADFVHQQTGATIDVHCPDGVKPDKGTKVTCSTVLSGADTDISILFTEKGKFRIVATRLKQG
jgi:hypothetical protein